MTQRLTSGCLDGVRVVEVAFGVAGAYCSRLLATFGADVLKVEPVLGDATRVWGPFAHDIPDHEHSLLFQELNLNKRGVTLDINNAAGEAVLHRLLAKSDALILEGESPRWTDEHLSRLQRDFPDLVVSVMRPFGLTGPYRDYLAEGLNIFEAGGSGYMTPGGLAYFEHPDRQPVNFPGHTSDRYWGAVTAIGVLAALFARRQVGGQLVDASGQEAHLAMSRQQISYYANDQMYETRETNHTAFAGCVPCADGYVEIYAMSNAQWHGVLEMMDNPEWGNDERLEDPDFRVAHGKEIDEHLFAWAAPLAKKEIYRRGQAFGVPVAYFATPMEAASIPQEQARAFMTAATHPVSGTTAYPFTYAKLAEAPNRLQRTAPQLGEHNGEVYGGLLGMTAQEMTALARMGVI
jgi:crotonobetainyl-CoA:carnitine CoA-transferase CaiB-like acyl-CoA transferase